MSFLFLIAHSERQKMILIDCDMPEGCEDCFALDAELLTCQADIILRSVEDFYYDERPEWCPIVGEVDVGEAG